MDEAKRRFLVDLGKAKALSLWRQQHWTSSTKKNSENRLLRDRQVER